MKKLIKDLSKIILTGILVGIIIGIYQLLVLKISNSGIYVYEMRTTISIIFIVIFTFSFCLLSNYCINKIPDISGSGIPQTENYLHKNQDLTWYKVLPGIFFNSLFSFFTGLSLGSEGPSVSLGANTGIMVNSLYKEKDDLDNVRIAAGSGFGCAFLSPLSGVIYTFEKTHPKLSLIFLLKTIVVVVIAYFTSSLINHHKLINFEISRALNFKLYYILFFIYLLNLITSIAFKKLFMSLKDFFKKHSSNFLVKYRFFIIVFITILIGIFATNYIGSGSQILESINEYKLLKTIILLILFKLIFTIISGNSKATGGLLIPIFTIGALNGLFIHSIFNVNSVHLNLIIFISTLSMFSFTTHSPLSALALGISHTSFKYIFIPLLLILIMGTYTIKRIKDKDIYSLLIERL